MTWIARRLEIGREMALGTKILCLKARKNLLRRHLKQLSHLPRLSVLLWFLSCAAFAGLEKRKKDKNIFASHERSCCLLVLEFLKCQRIQAEIKRRIRSRRRIKKKRNRFPHKPEENHENYKLLIHTAKKHKILLRKRSCLWLFTILFRRRRFWKLS